MAKVSTMRKYTYLSIRWILIIAILAYPQLSISQTSGNTGLGGVPKSQSVISFVTFEREFKFTNSAEDYHRSFQRLVKNYGLRISQDNLSEILLELNEEDKVNATKIVSAFVEETRKFSLFIENQYYPQLEEFASGVTEINVAAAVEIALVDEVRKIISEPTPLSKNKDNKTRFIYLINHARYELLAAILNKFSRQH